MKQKFFLLSCLANRLLTGHGPGLAGSPHVFPHLFWMRTVGNEVTQPAVSKHWRTLKSTDLGWWPVPCPL